MACNCTGACRQPPFTCGGGVPLQSYAIGFVLTRAPEAERTWGRYVRNGVTRYRNYGRTVRNGVSLADVRAFGMMQAQARAAAAMTENLARNLFS